MTARQHVWAVVLAAGEGLRLRRASRGGSDSQIPKQYRKLDGLESMLQWTLRRAVTVTAESRVVVVVARDHRCWWEPQLADHPDQNIVVQPHNRGTAVGILLPLLEILARDPIADILILPSTSAS